MLKQLILQKRLEEAKANLQEHLKKEPELRARREAFKTREAELESTINEITADTPAEDREIVEKAVEEHENEGKSLDEAENDFNTEKDNLSETVAGIENELDELQERTAAVGRRNHNREVDLKMENRTKFFNLTMEQRDKFFANTEVKTFLDNVRSSTEKRGITGGKVAVPTAILELLRENMGNYSKLIKYVRLRTVKGKARQPILGVIPEGVWIEATGKLNELDLSLTQAEVDGYLVGGFIPVANTTLEDGEDISLATEIMQALGEAIGKGIDRAIPYGTGVKMPLGFVTRLAQTEQPADYPEDAPEWKDLHTSNVLKIDSSGKTGVEFFAELIAALASANPKKSDGKAFWIMNRRTHIDIMTKALAFNSAAALVAGMNNQMPIVGGDIIELDDDVMKDYEIAGGFGSVYLLAERDGARVDYSEHTKFVENQTVFRGVARYDGTPVVPEAFCVVSYDNTDVTISSVFPPDEANENEDE